MEKKEFLYKILLLGDSSVGKTCFFMQYVDNTFHEVHISTVGLDNKIKDVELDDNVCIILVGNKSDLEDKRQVSKEQGESMAAEYGLMHFECSAKTGENIHESFNELLKKTVENFSKAAENIQLRKIKKKNKKNCC